MQPKIVVFDMETTGLFQFKDKITGAPIPADDPSQPRMDGSLMAASGTRCRHG